MFENAKGLYYSYDSEYFSITWINTGHGWINGTQYDPPTDAYFVYLAWNSDLRSGDRGVRLADVNGDGLVDIVQNYYNGNDQEHYNRTWINNGSGWVRDATYDPSSDYYFSSYNVANSYAYAGDRGVRLADVNGDGLVDIVQNLYDKGDSEYYNRTWISRTPLPDLLSGITTEIGGKYSFDYVPSTKFDNTGADGIPDLPYLFWVVNRTTIDNGMTGDQHTEETYTYEYSNGLYDHEDKEFRGFSYVKVTDPKGTTTQHYFHQDDARKGREYKTIIKDSAGNPYTKTENTWSYTEINGKYNRTFLDQTDEYTYDGVSSSPRKKTTQYDYDSYGNVIKVSSLGDAAAGDEKYLLNEYTYSTSAWIVDKPKHTYLQDENLNKVSESWYYYDGHTSLGTPPTKGELTKEVKWLDTGSNPETLYDYDTYGNPINVTDTNGYSTLYEYDTATHTFPVRITNARGQSTDYTYDLGTGNLLSTTDPNGFTTSYGYDGLGRIVWENRPYDDPETGEITRFSDSIGGDLGTAYNITFLSAGSNTTAYIKLPKNIMVTSASLSVSGYPYPQTQIYDFKGVTRSTSNYSAYRLYSDTPFKILIDEFSDTQYQQIDTSDNIYAETAVTHVYPYVCARFDINLNSNNRDYLVYWKGKTTAVSYYVRGEFYIFNWTSGGWHPISSWTDNNIERIETLEWTDPNITSNFIRSTDNMVRFGTCSVHEGDSTGRVYTDYVRIVAYTINPTTSLSISNTQVWSITGELNSTNSPQQITSLPTALNSGLAECDTPDPNNPNYCLVQLNVTSNTTGSVELSSLSVTYSDYLTKTYTYSLDGTAPESVKVSQREQSGTANTFDTYTFVDGLGRVIQTRIDAEDSTKQIVQDTFYNEIGKIENQSAPYLATKSTGYVPPDITKPGTDLEYDPIGRNILVRNTDDTVKTTAFDHWEVTSTDENGNQKVYYLDAYSRIKQVDEKNQGDTYTTTYKYDALDNLVKITDDQNNVILLLLRFAWQEDRYRRPGYGCMELLL